MSDDTATTPSLYAKLAEVMGEVGSIAARGRNDFLGTSYITDDDAMDAVREKLASRNIVVLPSLGTITRVDAKTAKGKETALTTAEVVFTFCDGDTGQTHACSWAGVGEDLLDKGLTKAETSALRTFLLKTFLVSATSSGAAPQPAPRSDGQAPITQEQFDGINAAFAAAGQPYEELDKLLDAKKVPRSIQGRDLPTGERCTHLSSLDAISVHKALLALEPTGPVR